MLSRFAEKFIFNLVDFFENFHLNVCVLTLASLTYKDMCCQCI